METAIKDSCTLVYLSTNVVKKYLLGFFSHLPSLSITIPFHCWFPLRVAWR